MLQTSTPTRGLECITQEHRYRKRSYATRHRGQTTGYCAGFRRVNIADQRVASLLDGLNAIFGVWSEEFAGRRGIGNAINTDIYYGRTRFYVIAPNEAGAADSGNQNVCLPRHLSQIAGAGMT